MQITVHCSDDALCFTERRRYLDSGEVDDTVEECNHALFQAINHVPEVVLNYSSSTGFLRSKCLKRAYSGQSVLLVDGKVYKYSFHGEERAFLFKYLLLFRTLQSERISFPCGCNEIHVGGQKYFVFKKYREPLRSGGTG